MKIAISAETTVDLTKELISEFDVKIVPFTILLGDVQKLDGDVSSEEIMAYVDKTKILPKTSAVNEFQFKEHFDKILSEGYDRIIHFSLSSEISSAYQNASKVAFEMDNKVKVFDSRTLSTGIALEVIYASKLVKDGYEFDEIIEKVEKRIPYVQASFVLERLDYLYKGGRCSGLAFLGANIFGIKPQILVINGKMQPGKKYKGNMEGVVKKYCYDTLDKFNKPDLEEVFITYTTATEGMLNAARNILVEAGFKNIHETHAGGTITSHCGEHCLGILYINDSSIN